MAPATVVGKLHFDMKSRLLPPLTIEEREQENDSPTTDYARRETDQNFSTEESPVGTLDKIEALTADALNSPAPSSQPTAETPRLAPQVSARPKGRLIVAGILLASVGSLGFMLWNTFLRNAAYGVVVGKVAAISASYPGTLTDVYVRAGDTVLQGDVLAVVYNPELRASIDRLGDDLRTAQAEYDAQVALLALAAKQRDNKTETLRADYYEQRGKLLAEQTLHQQLTSKLLRRQELADRRAVSDEEIESLQFELTGLSKQIENLQQAVTAYESRLANQPTVDSANHFDAAQMQPHLTKIENYQAEIKRLNDKLRRGTLRAAQDGTIVNVLCRVGERANLDQPLLELLPSDALELVLYIKQNDIDAYPIGRQIELLVDPVKTPIECRVTRLGQRFEKPQSHAIGRYRPEEKLLPVYLTPIAALSTNSGWRIGSTIRQPTSLFGP